jgi:hypothetical protein
MRRYMSVCCSVAKKMKLRICAASQRALVEMAAAPAASGARCLSLFAASVRAAWTPHTRKRKLSVHNSGRRYSQGKARNNI